jgi:hypothetical protein
MMTKFTRLLNITMLKILIVVVFIALMTIRIYTWL